MERCWVDFRYVAAALRRLCQMLSIITTTRIPQAAKVRRASMVSPNQLGGTTSSMDRPLLAGK